MQGKAPRTLDNSSLRPLCLLNLARSSCSRSSSRAKPPALKQSWCCLEVSPCWLSDLPSSCSAWNDRSALLQCCCDSKTRPHRFVYVALSCYWSASLLWHQYSGWKPSLGHL